VYGLASLFAKGKFNGRNTMIMDAELMFSEAQAITATAASTNQVDLGPSKFKTSNGRRLEIELTVVEAFTAGGAATLTVQLRTDDNSGMATPIVLVQSDVLALADLTLGARVRFELSLPPTVERYVDLRYVVATGPMTAGKLSARVTTGRQTNR
jgi:hypothetical protein